MFKPGLDFTIHDSKTDPNGRFIVLDLSLFEQRLTFACIYGYNTVEPSLFDNLLRNISNFSNTIILLCGDWNVVQDFYLDTYNILNNKT